MSSSTVSAFARLKDLASESSSEKRRELLRSITDLFLGDPCERSDAECMLFDDVVGAVVKDMQASVKAELAEKLTKSKAPVHNTLRTFAMDEDINVARPVLENSSILSDDDLIEIVTSRTQEHIMAISKRAGVSEKVSDAIVDHGTEAVIASLLENSTAQIGRESMEKVADKAQKSALLQKSFVGRDDVPLDLLNELVMLVENDLRNEIMKRFEGVSEQELDAALARSRRLVRKNFGKQSREQKLAEAELDNIQKREALGIGHLHRFIQANQISNFCETLHRLSGIGYASAHGIYMKRDIDGLAFVMKALDAPLQSFATIAAYVAGKKDAVNMVTEYAAVYRDVSPQAAARALRFWKVRGASSQEEAA